MAPSINVCTICEGVQIIGADGVGRDVDGTPTPMIHNADRLFLGPDVEHELDSWHLDCAPPRIVADHQDIHGKAIEAARKGTRGDKLIALIGQRGFNVDDPDEYKSWLDRARAAAKGGGAAKKAALGPMLLMLMLAQLLAGLWATMLAAALDTALGNALLDVLLPNAASGTLTLGSITLTRPYNCRFQSTRGTAAANGTNITGTNSTGINGLFTNAAANVSNVPTKSNTGAISITASSSGTWNGVEIWDTSGTPQRVLFGPTSDLNKAFASSDILSVPATNMTGTAT